MLTFALAVIPAASQAPVQKPSFEVASVKPVNAGPTAGQRGASGLPGGVYDIENHRFTARRVTLYALVKWSYGIGLTGQFTFEVKFAPIDNNAFGNTSSPSVLQLSRSSLD
jgi:hypothetical protein